MVDIISKKSGPRREDVVAKRLINENRATITKLADQLSGGKYSARHQRPAPPQPDGLILHDMGGTTVAETEFEPYVRITMNGRVVLVDGGSNKQLHHLGELRDTAAGTEFVLATRDNGFFSPLDGEVSEKLTELDHAILTGNDAEEELTARINGCLGLV
jgi:hypothetical protein